MLEFLQNNWKWIVEILSIVITFVVLLLRKRIKLTDSAVQEVLKKIPGWIVEAEKTGFTGQEKLLYVLNFALQYLESKYGEFVWNDKTVKAMLIDFIEAVLETPTKKLPVEGE